MLIISLARAEKARALVGAAVLGSIAGLAIGGAYLAGGLARATVSASQVQRLATVASQGYSNAAIDAATAAPPAVSQRANTGPVPSAHTPAPQTQPSIQPPTRLAQTQLAKETAKPFQLAAAAKGRDLDCLTQAVYYEARGEGSAGQAAVAQVILNRVRHPAFPKSVCAVVFQGVRGVGCQFSFACDGSVRRVVENAAWRRAREIAENALEGAVMAQVGTATHFHAARVGDPFGDGLKKVAQVGAHIFYRFSGQKGAGKAFSSEPEVSLAEAGSEAPAASHAVYASFAFPNLLPSSSSETATSVAAPAADAVKPVAAVAAKAAVPAMAPPTAGSQGSAANAPLLKPSAPVAPMATTDPKPASPAA